MAKMWQRWVAQLFKNPGYRSAPGKIHDTNKTSTHFPKGEIEIRTSTDRTVWWLSL